MIKEICLCNHGKIGKEKRAVANEKQHAYYKSAASLEKKKRYHKKEDIRRQILNQLSILNVSKKAHLCHEDIEQLVEML